MNKEFKVKEIVSIVDNNYKYSKTMVFYSFVSIFNLIFIILLSLLLIYYINLKSEFTILFKSGISLMLFGFFYFNVVYLIEVKKYFQNYIDSVNNFLHELKGEEYD